MNERLPLGLCNGNTLLAENADKVQLRLFWDQISRPSFTVFMIHVRHLPWGSRGLNMKKAGKDKRKKDFFVKVRIIEGRRK